MRLFPDRGPWRHRDFRRLWGAMAISAIGSRITRTALPVIAVGALAASATEAALIGALAWGPGALVGLFAGGWIDRRSKRTLLVGADVVRLALVLTVPIAWWTGALTLVHVGMVAAGVGAASSLFQITDNTYLPEVVGRDDLVDANATIEATDSIAEISGPAAAGVLIRAIGAPLAVVVDAATYAWSALLLLTIRPSAPAVVESAASKPSVLDDLRTGMRALWRDEVVRRLALAEAVSLASLGFFLGLYMVFVLRDLALSEATVGVIIGFGGVGALGGALIAPRLAARDTRTTLVTLSFLAHLGALFIPAARGNTVVIVALLVAHQLLGDGARTAYEVLSVSLRQRRLPAEVLGRANGAFHAIMTTSLLVGALASAGLAGVLTTRTVLWLGLGAGLFAPLPLLTLPRDASA
ncbi:MAG TPA: MFS transporter [Kofleriaceae bacterium]|nr:MFS transporter [Kofleriaceae bacterium]